MKGIVLVLCLISKGLYSETFATVEDCQDALVLASLVRGDDVYTGECFEAEDFEPGEPASVMLP